MLFPQVAKAAGRGTGGDGAGRGVGVGVDSRLFSKAVGEAGRPIRRKLASGRQLGTCFQKCEAALWVASGAVPPSPSVTKGVTLATTPSRTSEFL